MFIDRYGTIWHGLARFQKGSDSESQSCKWVMTNHELARYTQSKALENGRLLPAKSGASWPVWGRWRPISPVKSGWELAFPVSNRAEGATSFHERSQARLAILPASQG